MDIYKRTFYVITAGEFVSNIGDRFQKIAFPILIYRLFHSSFAMGGMVIVELLPQLLLGFFMGYILDRYDRKIVMIISILFQMFLCLFVPFFHRNNFPIELYYGVAFMLPAFSMLFETSFSVVTPTLFKKEELQKYNSQFQAVRTISKLVSPALAGLLLLKWDIDTIFFINSFSFLLLLIATLISKIPKIKNEITNDKWEAILSGFRFNLQSVKLRTVLIYTIIVNISMVGFNSTIVFYLKSQLQLTDQLVGIVYSLAGFGSLIGAILLSTKLKSINVGKLTSLSMISIPAVILISGIDLNWIFFGICYAILSSMITIASVSITTIQQQESKENELGRVMASAFIIATILAPLGGIVASIINNYFTPQIGLFILGFINSFFIMLVILYNRKERKKLNSLKF
ncbi:MFS transporter [Lactovum odontotermitis]